MKENTDNQDIQSSTIEQVDEWRIKHGLPPIGERYVTQRMSDYIQNGDYHKDKESDKWRGKEI